jgi:hypothetical protein
METEHSAFEAETTVRFVRRNGRWFYRDYAFLGWSASLIGVAVVGALTGAAYAAVVISLLVKRDRLRSRNWAIKIFIPPYWPSLFREAALAP